MNTFLGACVSFGEPDVDEAAVAGASVLYLEGYLFDPPAAQAAFHGPAGIAHAAGRQVALSLSDAFCVDRHRAAFRALVAGHVDILFANEAEICSLYELDDFEAAASAVHADVGLAALTRSEDGSVILRGTERVAGAGRADAGGRHDGGRGRLCRRFPGRTDGGAVAGRLRATRQHCRGGGDQPLRRAAPGGSAGAHGACD